MKHGKIVDGRYIWYGGKPLPDYFEDGNDILPIYSPMPHTKTHKFYMGDSEELYKQNLKDKPEDWVWRDQKVEYNMNSLGYRTKEFDEHDWKESIVVFGCSCVFGVGVDNEQTLPHYISELTARNVINLGIPGGSNQRMLDLSLAMKRKYGEPYSIIMMWTCMDRLPYYTKNGVHNIGLWSHTITKHDAYAQRWKSIFDNFYEEDSHEKITFYNIAESMRNIWSDKTKYYDSSYFESTSHYGKLNNFHSFSVGARDLLHPGPNDHKNASKEIVANLIQKYGKNYMQPGGLGHDFGLL